MSQSLLTKWYANPQSIKEAQQNIARLNQHQQIRYRRGIGCRICQLQLLIAHFWLDADIKPEIETLLQQNQHQRRFNALINLVYGQLLISKRLNGAHHFLNEAFKLSSPLLTTENYFKIYHQHQLLKALPLNEKALPAEDLKTLITMAEVILRFPQQKKHKYRFDPSDLYG